MHSTFQAFPYIYSFRYPPSLHSALVRHLFERTTYWLMVFQLFANAVETLPDSVSVAVILAGPPVCILSFRFSPTQLVQYGTACLAVSVVEEGTKMLMNALLNSPVLRGRRPCQFRSHLAHRLPRHQALTRPCNYLCSNQMSLYRIIKWIMFSARCDEASDTAFTEWDSLPIVNSSEPPETPTCPRLLHGHTAMSSRVIRI